jgi:hypothetical protein
MKDKHILGQNLVRKGIRSAPVSAQILTREGARYGPINVDQVLGGADTIAAHVSKLADQHRARVSEELLEPLENDAVTFCPDMCVPTGYLLAYS